jgi:hypothetical protein
MVTHFTPARSPSLEYFEYFLHILNILFGTAWSHTSPLHALQVTKLVLKIHQTRSPSTISPWHRMVLQFRRDNDWLPIGSLKPKRTPLGHSSPNAKQSWLPIGPLKPKRSPLGHSNFLDIRLDDVVQFLVVSAGQKLVCGHEACDIRLNLGSVRLGVGAPLDVDRILLHIVYNDVPCWQCEQVALVHGNDEARCFGEPFNICKVHVGDGLTLVADVVTKYVASSGAFLLYKTCTCIFHIYNFVKWQRHIFPRDTSSQKNSKKTHNVWREVCRKQSASCSSVFLKYGLANFWERPLRPLFVWPGTIKIHCATFAMTGKTRTKISNHIEFVEYLAQNVKPL